MGRSIVVVLDEGACRPESILKKFGGLGVRVFIYHHLPSRYYVIPADRLHVTDNLQQFQNVLSIDKFRAFHHTMPFANFMQTSNSDSSFDDLQVSPDDLI